MIERNTHTREADARQIAKILTEKSKSGYIFNINGQWGIGKSYLSTLIESNLDANNIICLKIDLSNYENSFDHLSPVIISLLNYLNSDKIVDTLIRKKFIDKLATSLEILLSLNIFRDSNFSQTQDFFTDYENSKENDDPQQIINIKNNLDKVRTYHYYLIKVKEALADFLSECGKQIVLFVNGLDRVDIKFAFKVLNALHNLKQPNIAFCLMMNRGLFEQRVESSYGKIFTDDENYLFKYIDFEYVLLSPLKGKNVGVGILADIKIDLFTNFSEEFANLSIRELKELKYYYESYKRYISHRDVYESDYHQFNSKLLIMILIIFVKNKFPLQNLWHDILDDIQLLELLNEITKFKFNDNYFNKLKDNMLSKIDNNLTKENVESCLASGDHSDNIIKALMIYKNILELVC